MHFIPLSAIFYSDAGYFSIVDCLGIPGITAEILLRCSQHCAYNRFALQRSFPLGILCFVVQASARQQFHRFTSSSQLKLLPPAERQAVEQAQEEEAGEGQEHGEQHERQGEGSGLKGPEGDLEQGEATTVMLLGKGGSVSDLIEGSVGGESPLLGMDGVSKVRFQSNLEVCCSLKCHDHSPAPAAPTA